MGGLDSLRAELKRHSRTELVQRSEADASRVGLVVHLEPWSSPMRSNRFILAAAPILAVVSLAACGSDSRPVIANHAPLANSTTVHAVADSAYSIDSQLARFRSTVATTPTRLENGAPSLDSLVHRFARALDAADRAQLSQLQLSRAEFAYLYYPESPLARKPYELDPELMWMQVTDRSVRGISRAVAAFSHGRLHMRGFRCEAAPMRLRLIVLYNSCTVTHDENGRLLTEPLFGSIIERGGVFKFVGYSNHL